MSHADDFIVSVHALERFEQRFPTLYTNEEDVGMFIYEETLDALESNRISYVLPVEFASDDLDRWDAGRSQLAWTHHRTRGYVLHETEQGMVVATVLQGRPADAAREKRYGRSKNKMLRERNAYGYRIHPNASTLGENEAVDSEAGVGEASA